MTATNEQKHNRQVIFNEALRIRKSDQTECLGSDPDREEALAYMDIRISSMTTVTINVTEQRWLDHAIMILRDASWTLPNVESSVEPVSPTAATLFVH